MGRTKSESASGQTTRRLDRRTLLTGGAVGFGLGGLIGAGGTAGAMALDQGSAVSLPGESAGVGTDISLGNDGALPGFGREALPCHGVHQVGIVTAPAAHVRFIAYSLRPETDRAALERMFRVLTDDIEGLTSGAGPLADPEPELAARPARLSVTVGVGEELVNRVHPALRPEWLEPLPAFSRDELGAGFDGGDVLLIVQADDPLPIAHASRMLARDLDRFATRLWSQQGFRQARGAEDDGRTMRNLMGQIDGTVNPEPTHDGFASLVWLGDEAGAFAGGSAFVLRRIRMELDTWDMVDRPGREATIGRRLADGSPLTASVEEASEHTAVDFEAKNSLGLPIMGAAAHVRRAHSVDPAERIFRRAVNYDDGNESGLLFACYQRDPRTQFVPIQQRLDELDMLNEWVTHTGSAVFAILPGFAPDGTLGESLFAA
jgi:dye decolorizing peroxidase